MHLETLQGLDIWLEIRPVELAEAQIILKAVMVRAEGSNQRMQPMYQTAQAKFCCNNKQIPKCQWLSKQRYIFLLLLTLNIYYGSFGPLLSISFTSGPGLTEKPCQLYDQGKKSNDRALQKLLKNFFQSDTYHFYSHSIVQNNWTMAKPDHRGVKNKILPQGDLSREGQKLLLNNNKTYHRAEEWKHSIYF